MTLASFHDRRLRGLPLRESLSLQLLPLSSFVFIGFHQFSSFRRVLPFTVIFQFPSFCSQFTVGDEGRGRGVAKLSILTNKYFEGPVLDSKRKLSFLPRPREK